MACEEEDGFCENYLLINPEKASFFDLVRILFSNNLERRDFFKCPGRPGLTRFRHRWIVFISALLQKVLLCLKAPLAVVGSAIELLLNFPAANGGCRRLFCHLLKGRVVIPDKASATFKSMAGNVDKRMDLDPKIENGSRNYRSALAIMASKLSYENHSFVRNIITNHWKMEFMEFYNFWNDFHRERTTQAILFEDKNVITVAFRGTEPFNADDWRTDVDISWYEFEGVGRIHGGFMKALGLQRRTGWPNEISIGPAQKSYAYYTIRDRLKALLREKPDAKFVVTGHSLGGALAILFVSVLAMHREECLLRRVEGVYTFGQPRVGNERFGEWMKEKLREYGVEYSRYVYSNDIVPRLPYDDDKVFMFKHFGACLYFNSCYIGYVLPEEPNKNYFSLVYAVPKILTAIYELIRSFILPWRRGKDYEEGWVMKLLRLFGLAIPGFADHVLVDYVNLTRIGKLPSSVDNPEGFNQVPKED